MHPRFLFYLLLASLWPSLSAAVIIESGDFVAEIQRLRNLSFPGNSHLYVAPDSAQRAAFRDLAGSVASADLTTAEAQAAALNYELVSFSDSLSGHSFLGLREKLTGGDQTMGWGSYFFNTSWRNPLLVEAPHPRFDINTWEVAAQVFRDVGAAGFLMAGAHRNANGFGTADVAHLSESIFQEVHETWTQVGGGLNTVQIHGFALANHPIMPNDTAVVLSAGDGSVNPQLLALDTAFESAGFVTYGYNTLAPNSALNQELNGTVPGTDFSGLGATTNVQGQYSRGVGADFVHVELAQSIRFDSGNRKLSSEAIVMAMDQAVAVSAPAPLVLILAPLLWLVAARKKSKLANDFSTSCAPEAWWAKRSALAS